ncbi:expressed unknown protein [Seminavis robusta]|uniref:Uncharacterized protein n=1 Tax=Seminavis robusta TaxID=568900 RepID=A0A9N8HWG2_9STRA|nr:expressed unknown protein [Seminavis robusta]|eukprot:Sro2642_g333470.1 n/a (381) ;mRNA; f:9253-10558
MDTCFQNPSPQAGNLSPSVQSLLDYYMATPTTPNFLLNNEAKNILNRHGDGNLIMTAATDPKFRRDLVDGAKGGSQLASSMAYELKAANDQVRDATIKHSMDTRDKILAMMKELEAADRAVESLRSSDEIVEEVMNWTYLSLKPLNEVEPEHVEVFFAQAKANWGMAIVDPQTVKHCFSAQDLGSFYEVVQNPNARKVLFIIGQVLQPFANSHYGQLVYEKLRKSPHIGPNHSLDLNMIDVRFTEKQLLDRIVPLLFLDTLDETWQIYKKPSHSTTAGPSDENSTDVQQLPMPPFIPPTDNLPNGGSFRSTETFPSFFTAAAGFSSTVFSNGGGFPSTAFGSSTTGSFTFGGVTHQGGLKSDSSTRDARARKPSSKKRKM